jgi:hypothetical protein
MNQLRVPPTENLWRRTTKNLGKWFAGMVTLPDSARCTAAKKSDWNDYPRFPAF